MINDNQMFKKETQAYQNRVRILELELENVKMDLEITKMHLRKATSDSE